MNVVDKDLGWKRIMNSIQALNGKEIKAGVLESAGNESNGQSIAQVAIWNEYGTKKIPSRPFVTIATDVSKGWMSKTETEISKIMSNRASVDGSLDAIGNKMKTDIQKVIGDKGKLAPNAPSTIRRKGHDKPLIDTGKLKEAINFEVK